MAYDEAVESKKESVTDRELNQLEKTVYELQEGLQRLHKNLSPILTSQPESISDSAKTPSGTLSPVPNRIRSYRENVEGLNYLVKSILSRLEI